MDDEEIAKHVNTVTREARKISGIEPDFDEMTDDEIIKAGYCPVCHAELQYRGGCQECPNGCVGFCG